MVPHGEMKMGIRRTVSLVAVALAVLMLGGNRAPASAENLTGYCLDNGEAGCQDRLIPFNGNSIDFCEETCTLTNPTSVRGLNATLYDFDCRADGDSMLAGRVMILRQKTMGGKRTISLITRDETQPIIRCK